MPLHLEIIPALSHAVAPLAATLRAPVGDPFVPEWVVAPSQGVHRWLAEQLAESLGTSPQGRDGIAANIRFAFPGALVAQALGGRVADDPWEVGRLTMALLTLLDRQPALRPPGQGAGTLVAFARQAADRFDRYHVHRPAMVTAWAQGADVLTPVRGAAAVPVPEGQRWQPALWRALREQLGVPSPPERVAQALAALEAGTPPAGLPERVMLVGSSALAPLHLEVLLALARTVAVHAWLVHPSPGVLRGTLDRLQHEAARPPGWRDPQDDHPLRAVAQVALLDSWLRPAQGMQRQLAVRGIPVTRPAPQMPAPSTRLARLQALLRHDAPPAGAPDMPAQDDQSVRLHGCHGAARQVEVLREALLHAFRELPGLRPEEVLIVAPDLPGMAPHLETVFGTAGGPRAGAAAEPGALPLVVADRSLREVNDVAEALGRLLDAAMGRAGVADLRALTDLAVVRARFGVDAETVARWFDWAERAGVAWGLSGAHRTPFGIPADYEGHSWAHAARRLVLGALLPDAPAGGAREGVPGGVVPLPGVDVESLPAMGALLSLLGEVTTLAEALHGGVRPVGAWCDLLHRAVEATCAVTRQEQPQLAATLGMLQALAAESAGCEVAVPFADWHPLLRERLAGAPGHVVLRGGAITATSLVPLRGVPYRVVCLVGLDEGALVGGESDGADLLREQPLLGDPDPAGEQRQALLETVLAARDRLIVTYSAHDVRSGKEVPAIAPLAELRELLPVAGVALDHVQVKHPRHAIDAKTFTPGALGCAGAFGHLERQREAVVHATDATVVDHPQSEAPAILPPRMMWSLDDLATLLDNPAELFLQHALGSRVYDKVDAEPATIPLVMEPKDLGELAAPLLAQLPPWPGGAPFTVGKEAWADAGALMQPTEDEWRRALARAGTVPPGSYGDQVADLTLELVRQLHYQCRRKGHPMTPGASRPVRLAVDGVVVEGTVPGVHELADGTLAVVAVGTAPHTPRRRALQRTLLCALALAHPGQRVTSFWLGGHPKEPAKTQASRGEVTADHPRSELVSAWEALMALGQEAQYAPRPRFGQTAELLADRPKARRQFHEAVSNLKGWTPEARLYGLNPAFDAVYPQHGEVERFFFALTDVLTRLPSVDTCTAASVHPTWRSRK